MATGSVFRSSASALLCGCLVLSVTGCGGSDRPPLVEASGVLTVDGKTIEGASVSIISVEGGRPSSAITDAEGRFDLKSYSDADGVPAGEYKVAVVKISGPGADAMNGAAPPEANDDGEDEDDGSDGLSMLGGTDASNKKLEIIYHVPQRYENADSSGLKLTVPEDGTDVLKLDLSK